MSSTRTHPTAEGSRRRSRRRRRAAAEQQADLFAVLERELYRCRRFGRNVAVVGLEISPAHVDRIRPLLRIIDEAHVVGDRIVLIIPEADGEIAIGLVARLARELSEPLAHACRVAVFPDDALTVESLVAAAMGFDEVAVQPPAFHPGGERAVAETLASEA
jgi:hypothetical protein